VRVNIRKLAPVPDTGSVITGTQLAAVATVQPQDQDGCPEQSSSIGAVFANIEGLPCLADSNGTGMQQAAAAATVTQGDDDCLDIRGNRMELSSDEEPSRTAMEISDQAANFIVELSSFLLLQPFNW
jgi:hypothetical protein